MAKLLVALAAINAKLNGRNTEIEPNSVFDSSKADLSGISPDYFREPTEQEAALWTMQNQSRERTIAASVAQQQAPVSQMQQPATPNGPGGATQESDNPNGAGSVATDADSVGATEQGKTSATGSQGAPGGTGDAEKQSSEDQGKPKATSSRKKRGEDLA